ncbi:hypothetical protein [Maribacter sp. 4U21]|uniref:hypothetical protein n=1 Tax=Maribacter sp. 4U21 TaxID=1889779 RepID=UPI0015D4D62D|nr:hypothetical protein [Maribacter sp. 4U21]
MKKIVISASLCLLLSSCFTYRNIDLDKGEFNQEDIFKIIKTDEQIEKGKLYS